MAYLGFYRGTTSRGLWGRKPPADFCDFEANSKHFAAPFNGSENTKLASNIEYTYSGVFRIWQRGQFERVWRASPGDRSLQCGPGGEALAGGLGDFVVEFNAPI